MPYYTGHFVLVDQTVGDGYGLFRLAGIVPGHQNDLLAVDPTGGVDLVCRCLGTLHVLLAKSCVGASHRAGNTNFQISLNKRRNAQCSCYGEGQKTFLVERLRHEVVLLRFY